MVWVGWGEKLVCLFLLLRVKEINYAETLVLPYPPCAGGVSWALSPSKVPAGRGGQAQCRPREAGGEHRAMGCHRCSYSPMAPAPPHPVPGCAPITP